MSLELFAKDFERIRNLYNNYYFSQKNIEEQPFEEPRDILDVFIKIDRLWNDALAVINANQFYAISLVGPQGSGKTVIVSEIARRALENDFKVVYALPDDFINDVKGWIKKTINNPKPKNCLIIDDLSYVLDMQSRKNQALIKNLVSRFRHVFGGQLLVVYVTHRLHAAPPMLRNSGSWIFTAMQSADRDDAREIIGRNKTIRDRLESIYEFISYISVQGAKNGHIKFYVDDREIEFVWGTKENHGDGRLMVCYHGGELNIFNSKITGDELDLEKYRFKDNNIFTDEKKRSNNNELFE